MIIPNIVAATGGRVAPDLQFILNNIMTKRTSVRVTAAYSVLHSIVPP